MNSTDEKRSIGTTSQETHADINSSIKVLQTDILRLATTSFINYYQYECYNVTH